MKPKVLAGLFIIFLMISSVFGVVFYYTTSSPQTLEYEGITFRPQQNQLAATIDEQSYQFVFFPGDLEHIEVPQGLASTLDKPVLTITYDPMVNLSENLADAQYYLETQLAKTKTVERGLTNSSGTSLAERSCEDATQAQPVIELREAQTAGIVREGSCVIIKAADAYTLYQFSERVLFAALGVMP